LGIDAVCGASTADLDAGYPYLKQANEVVCLGPGPAAQSYLDMERLIQAAKQTRCSALHPGWGFLAENARFASMCVQHGVSFIGPAPDVIDRMGRKVASRKAAQAAGLPVVPGSDGLLSGAEEAVHAAESVGYPVALKADAGGGGRGIRRCNNANEVRVAFEEARREAAAAFGDAALYLEKYLEGGRHIEFQVFGDGQGQAIHLGERECSIQRRHQKLIEEAGSPALNNDQRTYYGELSAHATAHWRYAGAGTMEYLRAEDGQLYFLEMNTRLQVEHPVTEQVIRQDLAQWQFRIAAGQPLPLSQDEVIWQGHAIEVRINAEDPEQGFRPAPGTLEHFEIAGEGIRVDTHLEPGSKIPPYYDSLIGKVIATGKTREQAIKRLEGALAGARVEGVPTTIPLHRAVLAHPDFRAGNCDTLWLGRERKAGRL
ncbi:MAG: ATP-grasp domain-containing protein, partial [Planctomycetes bacterium]|nr:ATP-grasp domain-containing protein [Planctomycetota bacterium]